MAVRRVLAVSYRRVGGKLLAVTVDRSPASSARRAALSEVRRVVRTQSPRMACLRPAPARSCPPVKGTIAFLVGPA